jgi:RNA polymerase sigma-70 factor (ECF subfamily)
VKGPHEGSLPVDDKLLIRQCLKGRKEYFEPLVTKYEQPLFRYCFHLCNNKDDAMDLFQETWLKAVSKIHRYKDGYSFKTWLLSIATNEYRDRYRKAARRKPYSRAFTNGDRKTIVMNQVKSSEKRPDAALMEKEIRVLIKSEVARLKWDYRSVVVLHYFEGFTVDEISRLLDIPAGTVKSRLYNARKVLKSRMEGKL